jgi:hypothetical protein
MKRKIFKLSDKFLMEFLQTLNDSQEYVLKVNNPLPVDVQIIRSGYSSTGTLKLVLQSNDFDDLDEGQNYPIINNLTFSKLYK